MSEETEVLLDSVGDIMRELRLEMRATIESEISKLREEFRAEVGLLRRQFVVAEERGNESRRAIEAHRKHLQNLEEKVKR